MTVRELFDEIGRERVMAALGVRGRILRRYVRENRLPARWYVALCGLAGRDLPIDLFRFRTGTGGEWGSGA